MALKRRRKIITSSPTLFFVPFTPALYAGFDLLLPFTELIYAYSFFRHYSLTPLEKHNWVKNTVKRQINSG